VNVRQQLSEIAHVDQRAADRAVAEMIVSVWATPFGSYPFMLETLA
jgi:hypothetical protein